MSDTPRTDDSMFYAYLSLAKPEVEVVYASLARELERLLRECYNSGGLSPDLMRRVGRALGMEG